MVDPERVQRLLERVEEGAGHLRKAAERTEGDLLADQDVLAAVKYRFIVAIEACIDVGEHVIASEGLRAPEDFADVFASLGERNILPPGMVDQLRDMARFRNLLVHLYHRVDDRRVIHILKTRLGDLEALRAHIARSVPGR